MHKTNNSTTLPINQKENESAPAGDLLVTLDAQMAASGYGDEHPWRRQLASAISAAPATYAAPVEAAVPAVIVRAPYSQIHITDEIDDHLMMRSRQLCAVLRAMPVGQYSEKMMRLATGAADELVAAMKRDMAVSLGNKYGGELLAGQLAELLRMIQGDDGPCDLLWLCQQIADEMNESIVTHNVLVEVAA